jgi:ATPase subunit of ABC transporter with duplicated ATPase domains
MIIRPMPGLIVDESAQEVRLPSTHLENYVSWYRHLSQDQGLAIRLTDELREVMSEFEHFKFEAVGEQHRLLKAVFSTEGGNGLIEYRFGELSDGQRMLIALYTLLHAVQTDELRESTLLLDEPENFLALREIQPWLTALHDLCLEDKTQALLISHHPEFINYLLASPVGYWFDRESNKPTRIKPITADPQDGLSVAELIAMGWLPNE